VKNASGAGLNIGRRRFEVGAVRRLTTFSFFFLFFFNNNTLFLVIEINQ
jgi:hypothetical protein